MKESDREKFYKNLRQIGQDELERLNSSIDSLLVTVAIKDARIAELEQALGYTQEETAPRAGLYVWCTRVMTAIEIGTLEAAGLEVAMLVYFALKTENDAQFGREVDACVKAFWRRCEGLVKGENSQLLRR